MNSGQVFHCLVTDDGERWTTPAGIPRIPLSFRLLAHRPTNGCRDAAKPNS